MANQNNKKDNSKVSSRRNTLPIAAVAMVLLCAAVVFVINGSSSKTADSNASIASIDDDASIDTSIDASIGTSNEEEETSAIETGDPAAALEEQAGLGQSGDAPAVIAQGESLVIPVSEVTEEASFYPAVVDGADMEVLAVRASDGTIRTAFNTCQSCYTSGAGFYRFQEGELVCNNCGFHFSPDEVEITSGGCNPWPIFEENKTVSDDSILISYDFLSESKEIFANWKTAMNW